MLSEHPMAATMSMGPTYADFHGSPGPSPKRGPAQSNSGGNSGGVLWGPCSMGTIPGQNAPAAGPTPWAAGPSPSRGDMPRGERGDSAGGTMVRGMGPMPQLLTSSRSQLSSPAPAPHQRAAMDRAPAGKIPGDQPHGRQAGTYSGAAVISGQLAAAGTGIAPQTDARRMARPHQVQPNKPVPQTQLPPGNAVMDGYQRNIDALHSADMGYTGAHTQRDGRGGFEGTYGARHAEKSTKSVIRLEHPPNATQQHSPGGGTSPGPMPPWETVPRDRAQGVRSGFGGVAGASLVNGPSGLTGSLAEPVKGRGAVDSGANLTRNICMEAKGLTGTQDFTRPPHGDQWASRHTSSSLVVGPNGMVEAGMQKQRPVRGGVDTYLKHSSLECDHDGVHQRGVSIYTPIQHAGKATAGAAVQNAYGVSVMARTRRSPVDHEPAGHGAQMPWKGGLDDTYTHYQTQQHALARNNHPDPVDRW
ncbi:hypothetical protein FOA52_013822 [Chlamydomonas sp. UWO 241]|nr:hypothetical protein FOA52_013822 [Chlamydomonas sp. UWO 241]